MVYGTENVEEYKRKTNHFPKYAENSKWNEKIHFHRIKCLDFKAKKESSRMCMCNECELTFSIVCSTTCNIKNKTITTTTSTSTMKLNKRYRYSNAILNDSDDK